MAALSEEVRHQIIIEYWCRTLNKYIITDIVELIKDYSKVFESFDKLLSDTILTFNEDRTIMSRKKDDGDQSGWKNGFGTVIAKPGRCYEWKIDIIEHKSDIRETGDIFIGIIEADKCDEDHSYKNLFFFHHNYAIAYLSDSGHYYTGKDIVKFKDDPYGVGDIIGIHLDLKNNILYFSKNETKFGHIDGMIEQNAEYRLIVSFFNMGNAQKIQVVDCQQF